MNDNPEFVEYPKWVWKNGVVGGTRVIVENADEEKEITVSLVDTTETETETKKAW
jgi:transcription elongation GreA/GreB family factor